MKILATVATLLLVTPVAAQVCSGCSCRGGPGFRLPAGECASWKINAHFCDGACYPAGTRDERPAPAAKPPIFKPGKP